MTTEFIAYIINFAVLFLIYVIFALGLNIQWGQAGVMNFGLVAFMIFGAYITGILMFEPTSSSTMQIGLGLPFLVAFPIAVAITGAIAWLISSVVKLGLEELAIVTIALAAVVHAVCENEAWLTGGVNGLMISSYLNDSLSLFTYNLAFFGILLVTTAAVYYFTQTMNFSQFGRLMNAVRLDQTKARSLGINPVSYQVKAFVIGAMILAAGGGLWLYFITRVMPDLFSTHFTFTIWVALLLGGSGNNRGAVLGVAIYMLVDFLTRMYLEVPGHPEIGAGLKFVLTGLILVVVIVCRPQGILGPRRSRYGG